MTFLALAVAVQVSTALLLKIGELYQQDRLVVMSFNYLFAALVAGSLWAAQAAGPGIGPDGGWAPGAATWVLGAGGGFFYAAGLFLWMGAIGTAGLGVSTAAMRLAVIWPTLLSLLAFGERPTGAQLAGVALTFAVMGLLSVNSLRISRIRPGSGGFLWLLATFLINGGTGTTMKLFTEWGRPDEKLALLALLFATAGLMSAAPLLRRGRRKPLRRGDVLRGAAFGVGNVTSNGLVLLGLEHVSGVVAFPFTSITVILLTAIAGAVLWRERPGLLGSAAIALAVVAIVLLVLR